jgi:hypothetical protein
MAFDSDWASPVTRRKILVGVLLAAWLGVLIFLMIDWSGQFWDWLLGTALLLGGYAGIRLLARDLD